MKKLHRFKQQASEALGRGEKSDKLTQKLSVVEKKVEGIRSSVQLMTKKLNATFIGSGNTLEKHQRKLPQYALGNGMMEHGAQLGENSLFGSVMMMVGQAQQDIASQMANYEITVTHDIITTLNTMLEEDMKLVDKCKKKLGNARLDMDSARGRLKNFEQQIEKSTKEYNMEKLTTLRTEVDETSRKFEECQDAYATSMYEFISKEQEYTDKIQQLVKHQITHYKNAAVQLEGMLPRFEKKMNDTQDRPVFGLDLVEHLRISKRDVAAVIETCCNGLRKEWMDTEGLFRIAGGQSKVKFLKTSFDAGQFDVSTHDPHTIAGCLKMYLRELPDPLLTYDLYDDWMKATSGDEAIRKKNLNAVKERLPEANLNNLKFLCDFLNEFSRYYEVTKMSAGNIAIVIGPNLLWPPEESVDPSAMVTVSALQRCIAETFIEHCRFFFPDLPEPTGPMKSPPPSNITFTASSPSSFNSTTLQSYTSKSSTEFPSSPVSVASSRGPDTTSLSSTGSSDAYVLTKPKEDLPHPLAESANDEGVTVNIVEGSVSPKPSKKTKTSRGIPPPTPPKTNSSVNLTPPESPLPSQRNPPSPAPRTRMSTSNPSRSGSVKSNSGETPSDDGMEQHGEVNGKPETVFSGGTTSTPPVRPTPPIRTKRTLGGGGGGTVTPPTPARPPPYSSPGVGSGSGTLERKASNPRAPARRAPPPPKAKKVTPPSSDEHTSL